MTELELLKTKLADIKTAIDKEQKKTQWEKAATEMHDIYQAFLNAGFSEEQAWYMTGMLFVKAIK